VYYVACKTRGVWGHAPPGNFEKLDALRLLEAIWDGSRAIAATCLAGYCIHFLAVHVCMYVLRQLSLNFHERKY